MSNNDVAKVNLWVMLVFKDRQSKDPDLTTIDKLRKERGVVTYHHPLLLDRAPGEKRSKGHKDGIKGLRRDWLLDNLETESKDLLI